MAATLIWFRRDLRLADHAVVEAACRRGPVLPVFVLDDALLFHPETAVARVAFLLENLRALDHDWRRIGGRLLVRRGEPAQTLLALARAAGADRLMAHTDSERLVGRVRDARVNRVLAGAGIAVDWIEPAGATGALISYASWRRHWYGAMGAPLHAIPERAVVPEPRGALADLPIPSLQQLGLRPDAKPIPPAGTAAAQALLERFCRGAAARRYFWELSYPAAKVSTGLSPYLKFGVISPRQCLRRIEALAGEGDRSLGRSALQLASRLRWAAAITQRFRYLPQLELRSLWSPFDAEPLGFDAELYDAWREGRTGFPIVDAAARCLRAEGGWRELNFRSRAIYASFLANLGGIDWRYGALHFMRHLIDGDCPIDHYQWAMQAGVTYRGEKAWSRIYHPGQVAVDRCDPQGLFIRRWLPELAHLTNDQLGAPPPMAAYPAPILDYEMARRRRIEHLAERRCRLAAPGRREGEIRIEGQSRIRTPGPLAGLAELPADLTPFAAERFPQAVLGWAEDREPALFPPALDLASLDGPARRDLASWLAMARSGSAPGSRSRHPDPLAPSPATGRSPDRGPGSGRRAGRSGGRARLAPGQLSLDLDLDLDLDVDPRA